MGADHQGSRRDRGLSAAYAITVHARERHAQRISRSGWSFRSPSTTVPDEGLQMYPDVRFIPRGVGVRSLTPKGYDSAWEGILPAAEYLAEKGVDAIMVIGTSLTFYRGADFHDQLLEKLRAVTGPAGEHHEPGGGRWAAPLRRAADRGRHRLCGRGEQAAQGLSRGAGLRGAGLEGFGLFGFGEPGKMSEADIIALGSKLCTAAPDAEGLLISCGGLRTLGVAKPLEERHGVPVVSSTQAAFWAALRLVGESGHVAGRGHAAGTIHRRPCALRRFALNWP